MVGNYLSAWLSRPHYLSHLPYAFIVGSIIYTLPYQKHLSPRELSESHLFNGPRSEFIWPQLLDHLHG